jgi:disulfide bond formation protein DsbB
MPLPAPATSILSLAVRHALWISVVMSVGALLAALASEAFLGLEPCPLCIMQRWPYALAALAGAAGLALSPRFARADLIALLFSAGAFLVNSGIALYHTGVERHWWASMLEGCVVPHFSDQGQSMLENILSAPTGRCDEIPWADPVLGLSMANYNVMLGLALFALCALAAVSKFRKP